MKANKIKSFSIFKSVVPMLQRFSAVPVPGGKMYDVVSENDFREAAQA